MLRAPAGFAQVFDDELRLIAARRGAPDVERYTHARALELDLCGLALSGGGIRSAAFNLGLLQALADRGVLPSCDYLSTVSGGGYIGACLSSLTSVPGVDVSPGAFPLGSDRGGAAVRHVREHGEYLAPRRGFLRLDLWRLASTYLGGLLITLFSGAAMLGIAAAAGIVVYPAIVQAVAGVVGRPPVAAEALWGAPEEHLATLFAPVFVALALWVLCSLGYVAAAARPRLWTLRFRSGLTRVQGAMLFTAAVAGALGAVPLLLVWADREIQGLAPTFTVAWVVSALTAPGAFFLSTEVQALWGRVKRIVVALGAWVFVALICFAVLYGVWYYRDFAFAIAAGLLIALWLLSRLTDINRISMFYFYRDRLAQAFVFRVNQEGTPVGNDALPLTALAFTDRRIPYHLINTTINLPGSGDRRLRGRRGDFFLLSPRYCGSETTGYRPTTEYERGRVNLASAMGVSGAAANPQYGHGTSAPLAFLMSLLNVRLGVWSEHPGYRPGRLRAFGRPRHFWPLYQLAELFSFANERRRLVSLSDGGHIENLGAYELLRRRCRTVIVSDATADPDSELADLARLQRLARIDLRIEIELQDAPLRAPPPERFAEGHVQAGDIVYPTSNDAEQPDVGKIYYVKAGLTRNDGVSLHQYRRAHLDFPHESTADQFFDEAQFESYRELGYRSGIATYAAMDAEQRRPSRAASPSRA